MFISEQRERFGDEKNYLSHDNFYFYHRTLGKTTFTSETQMSRERYF